MFKNAKVFSSFSVNDLQAAKAFYSQVLELEVMDTPMGVIEFHLPGGHHTIVYPKPNHVPATFTVLNFVVENIEQAVEQLTSKGVVFEQYDEPIKTDEKGICRSENGPLIAWFKDPAGNILSVLQER